MDCIIVALDEQDCQGECKYRLTECKYPLGSLGSSEFVILTVHDPRVFGMWGCFVTPKLWGANKTWGKQSEQKESS
jgi:hypothetical protein